MYLPLHWLNLQKLMLKLCKNIKKLQFPTFESITHCFNAGVIAPLQPTKVILFTMTAQFGNHHSRYKTILSSALFCHSSVLKYRLLHLSYGSEAIIWELTTKHYWNHPLTLLAGSAPVLPHFKNLSVKPSNILWTEMLLMLSESLTPYC